MCIAKESGIKVHVKGYDPSGLLIKFFYICLLSFLHSLLLKDKMMLNTQESHTLRVASNSSFVM